MIISGRGEVHDFPLIAENLMEPYISSIQIAPNGVVTDIYPMQGNEAGLIDLIHDPVRGPVVAYAIEHDAITMQGPFELKQGGSGIAVRDPEDFERVMAQRRERFLGKADGDQVRLRFRIVTKRGRVKNVIAQARLRNHERFGDLHFVTCLDLDEE